MGRRILLKLKRIASLKVNSTNRFSRLESLKIRKKGTFGNKKVKLKRDYKRV